MPHDEVCRGKSTAKLEANASFDEGENFLRVRAGESKEGKLAATRREMVPDPAFVF
jgi:hypothetical protein